MYYGAPLSTMAEVIRTRNSASILLPLTLMNLINALLWTTYGVVGLTIHHRRSTIRSPGLNLSETLA